METKALVLIETNATWPSWIDTSFADAEVIKERPGSFGVELFELALHRIRALSPSLTSVVLVCSPASDAQRDELRETLMKGLTAAVDFFLNDGELVLVSDGDYGTRQALANLVWELGAELEQAQSAATVRFRAQPRSTAPPAPSQTAINRRVA